MLVGPQKPEQIPSVSQAVNIDKCECVSFRECLWKILGFKVIVNLCVGTFGLGTLLQE